MARCCYSFPWSNPALDYFRNSDNPKLGYMLRIVIGANYIPDLRCGVRFPLRLAITIHYNGQEFLAESRNISSAGALFHLDQYIPAGSTIEFTVAMPMGNFHSGKDVLVNCTGRVVRCSPEGDRQELAVIIDEYHFLRS